MKILSLKALNINSLKGKTEIDFAKLTQESSLFCITGSTGSGKSTLLDIISCALYGRTARLKNPNDLMSRNAWQSYCEVEFSIKGKVYRSSWTQKRARKKHDGTFQTAKMELVNVSEDKILDLKSREVPKRVEELSGLDFARFTQSMLLVQGGFDAFLRADGNERSALLEKITGTQIYAEVSQAIFERHRSFAQDIESDKKVLESVVLLEEGVVQDKKALLQTNIQAKQNTDRALKELFSLLTCLEKLSELKEERIKHESMFTKAHRAKEEQRDSFIKLDLANKALNVSATSLQHKELHAGVVTDKETSLKLQSELLRLKKEIQDAQKGYTSINEAFDSFTDVYELENKKLKEARGIQTQEKQTQRSFLKAQELLQTKQERLEEFTKRVNTLREAYRDRVEQVESTKLYLENHREEESLIARIGIIEQNIKHYKEENVFIVQEQIQYNDSKVRLENEYAGYTEQETGLNKHKISFERIESEYRCLEEGVLEDEKREEGVYKHLEETQNLLRAYETYIKLVADKDTELQEHTKNSEIHTHLLQTLGVSKEHRNELRGYIETLRDTKEKEERLKKYEDDRKNLKEGEACSLCGSTQHPFAHDIKTIDTNETQTKIDVQTKALADKEDSLKDLESRISVIVTKKETSELEMAKLDKELLEIDALFEKYAYVLNQESQERLKEREEELSKELQGMKDKRIRKDKALKQRDEANQQVQEAQKSLHTLSLSLEKVKSEEEQLTLSLESHVQKINVLTQGLENDFRGYGVTFDKENIDSEYTKLLNKKEMYEQTLRDLKGLETKLHDWSIEKKESETQSDSLQREIQSDIQNVKELERSVENLRVKGVEVLNVVDLDVYEEKIRKQYKELQAQEQLAKSSLDALEVKNEERLIAQKKLENTLREDEEKLLEVEQSLESLYKENNFKDAQAFEDAALSTEARESLDSLCKELEDAYKHAQTLQEQTLNKLKEHEKEEQSNRTVEELQNLQALLEQKLECLQESIGSDKKELALNEEQSATHKQRIKSVMKKQEALKVWVKLNELVGSADGAKFKKFAQGITLEQLINLANQHLRILSLRYTLVRNQEKLLELEIIDSYQGNAVRTVRTLSGGESFIVSLALALGLSELASQKIAIDSLFLDEGFGTLDEESLEIALNALNLLQNNGKMVGIISHVEALKERIPLQIKVVPNGDGSSFVEVMKR